MKTLPLVALAALVTTALLCPCAVRPVRADDPPKDPKIVITVKIPDDVKDLHKRTHPAP